MKKICKKIFSMFRPKTDWGMDPDEVFIDSSNLPKFDTHQLEGHLEKAIPKYIIYLTGIAFFVITGIFLYQSFRLQVVKGEEYLNLSENNRLDYFPIFANRGTIKDRNGLEIAWNVPNSKSDFSTRKYKDASGLGHLLGYIKYPAKDSSGNYYRQKFVGEDGVEKFMNKELNGSNGLKIVETNALGEVVSEGKIKEKKDGECITLSIDLKAQSALFDFIKKTGIDNGFKGGSGVIMDVNTGEIIALTSWPEYSPTVLAEGDDKQTINSYNTDPNKPFLNRAIGGLYTPGSVVKPFVALAALEENIISPNKEILSTGSISIPNPYYPDKSAVFKDWKAHGLVNMREALAVSSNVYFYEIGGGYQNQKGLGIENIKKYMKMFGFESKTGIDLENEKEGVIPTPKWKAENFEDGIWRIGDTYHTTIGQYGFQTTPIQMARAISSIANGGILYQPFLKKDGEKKGEDLPFSENNLNIVMDGMRLAVTEGIATGLNVSYVKIAAKTGTAERGGAENRVNSWIIGFFPYEDPKYAFAIVMEEGLFKNRIGGVYVMRQLLDWMRLNTPEYF